MQKVIGVTELQRRFRSVFDEVPKKRVPYVLTRGSRPEAALIPYEEFLRFQVLQEQDVLARFDRLVARLAEQAVNWEQRLAEDGRLHEELAAEAARLDDQLAELERCEEELQHLREQEGQARYLVGAAQQKLTALDQQRVRRTELVDQRQQLGQVHRAEVADGDVADLARLDQPLPVRRQIADRFPASFQIQTRQGNFFFFIGIRPEV